MPQSEAEEYSRRLLRWHICAVLGWCLLLYADYYLGNKLRASQSALNERFIQVVAQSMGDSKLLMRLITQHPIGSRTPDQEMQIDALLAKEKALPTQQLQLANQALVVGHRAYLLSLFQLPLIVAAAAAGFIFAEKRRRLRNRIARGLCYRCGYDLRASADRCPECGSLREATIIKQDMPMSLAKAEYGSR
jgi:hypothetical protein